MTSLEEKVNSILVDTADKFNSLPLKRESELPVPVVLGRGNTKNNLYKRTVDKILQEGRRIVFVKRRKEREKE